MDGIMLVNKEAGVTSRDVVNRISKKLNIKHVGHAGTLDPIAKGVMVLGIAKGTKIMELLTLDTKEYIATVKMGIKTDTFDITGNIISENYDFNVTEEDVKNALTNFKDEYLQTVPSYSAVKINGKKLYEYARGGIKVELPKRMVTIYNIELLEFDKENYEFKFKTLVSKGTYIRSLINDIGEYLNINCTMKDLIRTKSGKFKIEDCNEDKIISIKEALDIKSYNVKHELLKKIKNGNKIVFPSSDKYILFLDNDKEIAIYENVKNNEFKAFKVF